MELRKNYLFNSVKSNITFYKINLNGGCKLPKRRRKSFSLTKKLIKGFLNILCSEIKTIKKNK